MDITSLQEIQHDEVVRKRVAKKIVRCAEFGASHAERSSFLARLLQVCRDLRAFSDFHSSIRAFSGDFRFFVFKEFGIALRIPMRIRGR
jgi:hypothetical protein